MYLVKFNCRALNKEEGVMNPEFKMNIYTTNRVLILLWNKDKPHKVLNIPTVFQLNSQGRLYSMEIFLYREKGIDFEVIQKQFESGNNFDVDENMLFIRMLHSERPNNIESVSSFGLMSFYSMIYLSEQGEILGVELSWSEMKLASSGKADREAIISGMKLDGLVVFDI